MNILFAASEVAPFAKTGGLADVAGSLPAALAALGHDVRVIMPRYRQVGLKTFDLKPVTTFFVPIGAWKERCDVFQSGESENVTTYFVGKDLFYDRPELYGTGKSDYPDNAERFIFFSRAILELCTTMNFKPHILHCNDWQTGLSPLYLKKFYGATTALSRTKTVFTVHNLGYQGLFPQEDLRLTGLDDGLFTPEGIEFWGKINFLKAGLVYSDIITTVSKTYSREIQTREYGCGLEGVLSKRSKNLFGIINGIDYRVYDPTSDAAIPKTFSASKLEGKLICKRALQKMTGLSVSGEPLVGMVTRLADQKGLDILVEALPVIMSLGVQVVILGTGDEKYHNILTDVAGRYQGRMSILLQYNEQAAKMIYAGCDIFLMPSRYEPCGLGQMIALRYGAVPLVRKTGGLTDTIADYNPKTGRGTGFLFNEYSAAALIHGLRRALEIYRNKIKWKHLMQSGMKQDFSWERSAREYVKIYRKAMRKGTGVGSQ